MSRFPNGQLPDTALTTWEGVRLSHITAKAVRAMDADCPANLSPYLPLGGYRDLSEQAKLKANPGKYNSTLDPDEIAAPGFSSHGGATAIDIATGDLGFGWLLEHADEYGFTQRDARNDRNCWIHDGVTVARTSADAKRIHNNKVMARWLAYLNEKNEWALPATDTTRDGKRDGAYWAMLKRTGKARKDYSGKITEAGPTDATRKLESLYRAEAERWFDNR